ncbi:unnamed protein product, partial [marine sediment metagenome]
NAVTDETGSGLLVFGTSPTFTTQITVPKVIGNGTGLYLYEDGSEGIFIEDGGDVYLQNLAASRSLFIDVYSDTAGHEGNISFRKSHQDTVGLTETIDDEDLGGIRFTGVNSTPAFVLASFIVSEQDGAAGADYIPGRISFWTATDSAAIAKRMEIDNAGNIKMGDGAWTNYINITAAGVLTLE